MRRAVDGLYRCCGLLAAGCLMAIALLVAVQIIGRVLDATLVRAGLPVVGLAVPSLAEFAGYLLAAASFLALPDTLIAGGHIRVSLLFEHLGPAGRRMLEPAVAIVAAALCAYATVSVALLALKSLRFGDVSYGLIAIPLALPQTVMAFGLAVLVVALLDTALRAYRGAPTGSHSGTSL